MSVKRPCTCFTSAANIRDCPVHYPKAPTTTRTFDTGATRDMDQNKLDYEGFISPFVLECFSQYMHEFRLRNIPEGDEIRSSDNWQKGMPQEAYMKSMLRHVMEAWRDWDRGVVTLDVFNAILFNVQGMIYEELRKRGNTGPV